MYWSCALSSKTPFIPSKESMVLLVNKEINQFITSSDGLSPYNLTISRSFFVENGCRENLGFGNKTLLGFLRPKVLSPELRARRTELRYDSTIY